MCKVILELPSHSRAPGKRTASRRARGHASSRQPRQQRSCRSCRSCRGRGSPWLARPCVAAPLAPAQNYKVVHTRNKINKNIVSSASELRSPQLLFTREKIQDLSAASAENHVWNWFSCLFSMPSFSRIDAGHKTRGHLGWILVLFWTSVCVGQCLHVGRWGYFSSNHLAQMWTEYRFVWPWPEYKCTLFSSVPRNIY